MLTVKQNYQLYLGIAIPHEGMMMDHLQYRFSNPEEYYRQQYFQVTRGINKMI